MHVAMWVESIMVYLFKVLMVYHTEMVLQIKTLSHIQFLYQYQW